MTVYSRTISEDFVDIGFGKSRIGRSKTSENIHRENQDVVQNNTRVLKLNLFLGFAAFLTLFGYIVLSNLVTSQIYISNLKKTEFNQLSAATLINTQSMSENEDLKNLQIFAQNAGMIEAKDTGVILEDNNFALLK